MIWSHYFDLLARALHEARGEEIELRKSLDEAAVHVVAENHSQRWQYDNALLGTTQELKGQLYEVQAEVSTLIDLINTGRTLCAAGLHAPDSLPTWLATTSST